jgi:Tol biopolymer transport system component
VVAQRIDLKGLTMVGDVVPLVDRPAVVGMVTGAPIVDCARNGTSVYDEIDRRPTDLVSVGRDGRAIKTVLRHPGPAGNATLSHGGDRLAILEYNPDGSALWIADLSRETEGRVTPPDQTVSGMSWTPDDTRLISNTSEAGKRVLMSIDSRSGAQRVVRQMDGWEVPTSIAPDGTVLLDKLVSGRVNDIVYVPRGEGTNTAAYLETPANEGSAVISPDGRSVAYISDASGRQELYVDGFPHHGAARRVSTDGAVRHLSTDGAVGAWWRADGRELYFGAGRTMFACDVKTQPEIEIGKPRVLFEAPKEVRGVAPGPDGDKFFLLMPVGENPSALTVVQNWAAQLPKQGD